MDRSESKKRWRWQELAAAVVMVAVMVGVSRFLTSHFMQDLWKGWWYEEPAEVASMRAELELTSGGERIFLATRPALENAESFNEHCGDHEDEVSLLGCYNAGKIYVYDVKLDSLKDSNKVTAAHELLHAVWARMSKSGRDEVAKWLEQVRQENSDWVQEEVNLYPESQRLEELYVRVGTKLKEIPEELEKHYSKYFQNREKIIEFYENYQAPFRELQAKNGEIQREVGRLSMEIEVERRAYEVRLDGLNQQVESFNACANRSGCFSAEAFRVERAELERESDELDQLRDELNQKIERHNNLVLEYEANSRDLGELNDALNSNVKEKLD